MIDREEAVKVLRMVEAGDITPDEGARLIDALSQGTPAPGGVIGSQSDEPEAELRSWAAPEPPRHEQTRPEAEPGPRPRRTPRPGRKPLDLDELVQLRIHGVTPAFLEDMRRAGFELDLGQLLEARIHGVTGEFARAMAEAGFPNLSIGELAQARSHGVTPERATELREHFGDLNIGEVLRAAIHGLTPELATTVRAAGYPDASMADLLEVSIHGVSAGYIREMKELVGDVSLHRIVELKIHSVTPELIRDLQAAGEREASAVGDREEAP